MTDTPTTSPINTDIFMKNVKALTKGQPDVARLIPANITVDAHNEPALSQIELEKMLDMCNPAAGGSICVLGIRDGLLLKALALQAKPGLRIMVYEQDFNKFLALLVAIDLSEVFLNSQFYFVVEGSGNLLMLCEQSLLRTNLTFRVIRQFLHLPEDKKTIYQDFLDTDILDFAVQQPVRMATLDKMGPKFVHNVLSHITQLSRARPFGDLKDLGVGRPVFVIGCGPSLDDNRALLEKWHGRAVFIAADSALRTLQDWGINPEFVTSVDPQEATAKKIVGLKTKGIGLVYHPCASSLVEDWNGPTFSMDIGMSTYLFFQDGLWSSKGLGMDWLSHCQVHMAANIAALLGGRPTIMVGMDLALPCGKTHAALGYLTEAGEVQYRKDSNFITATNARGHDVATTALFMSYKKMWETRFRDRLPEGGVFNVVNQGLALAGSTTILLEETDKTFAHVTSVDTPFVLPTAKNTPIDQDLLKSRFTEFLLETTRIHDLALALKKTTDPFLQTEIPPDRVRLSATAERLVYDLSHPSLITDALITSEIAFARSAFGDMSTALDRVENPIERLRGQAVRANTYAEILIRRCEEYREIVEFQLEVTT